MIYNDLNNSEYFFEFDEVKLYFSSMFYKEKFIKSYNQFIKDETDKFKVRYKCNITADLLFVLLLYKKIEKRGFRVEYHGRKISENYYLSINFK